MRQIRMFLARFRANRRGIAAAEFALIAPIMVVCLLAVYDLGRALQQQIRLNQAVEAGGLFAMSYPYNVTGITSVITQAVSTWTDVAVATPVSICQCWNSVTFSTVSVGCTTSVCGGTSVLRNFISMGAQRPFQPIFFTTLTNTSVNYVVQSR